MQVWVYYVKMVDQRTADLNAALELLHFGFRGATHRPDELLAEHGFSRVHHRVLYFVGRNPGVTVGGLQSILGISKQALNGPLHELISRRFIAATAAAADRRRKQLRLTATGSELEEQVSESQRRRFAEVFASLSLRDELGWRRVMEALAEREVPVRLVSV